MWDRYDPRDDDRDRCNGWDRDVGGRGSTSDRARNQDRDPRDVFTKDLLEEWVTYKRTKEVDPVRLRPTPLELQMYYDC